ncbi:MAG: T9SS type A sorting domain-containing protein, partial [Bacteroidota bacterium]
ANIAWQEDPQAGGSGGVVDPGSPVARCRQIFFKATLTGVSEESGIPTGFKLSQNFPNPFNPATKIDYTIAKAGLVTIKVFDVLGREVATLLNEDLQPGNYQVTFDGKGLASGIYMYKMTANGYTATKRMMLVK